jgi:serine/threonine-protein kinase RsbW
LRGLGFFPYQTGPNRVWHVANEGFGPGIQGYPPVWVVAKAGIPGIGGGTTSVVTEELNVRLAGGRDAAGRARTALQALNGNLEALRDTVKLLVTELVTNSFRHAGAGKEAVIELRVLASPETVRVEVEDPGPGFEPEPREPGCEGGFGLVLVDELADRWGVQRERPCVWFELDRARGGAEPR